MNLEHVKRILVHHLPLFQAEVPSRRVPADLGGGTLPALLEWLLGLAAARHTEARHAAMELVYLLAAHTGTRPRAVVEAGGRTLEQFLEQVEQGLNPAMGLEAGLTREMSQQFQALFEFYYWILGNQWSIIRINIFL